MTDIFFLDRPEKANALDLATAVSLQEFIRKAVKRKQKGIIIAAKEPRIFCAGGDLQSYRKLSKAQGITQNKKIRLILEQFSKEPILIIAAVNGLALGGGCELALACDLITTSPGSRFSFRQTAMGLTPGWGGLKRLLSRVGPHRSLEWLASHRDISAAEALRHGLSDFIFPARQLLTESQRLIDQANSAVSIRVLKNLVYGHSKKEDAVFNSLWMGPAHKTLLQQFFE